jgi:hypothetical protein
MQTAVFSWQLCYFLIRNKVGLIKTKNLGGGEERTTVVVEKVMLKVVKKTFY